MKPADAVGGPGGGARYSASLGGGLIEAPRRPRPADRPPKYSASLGGGLIEARAGDVAVRPGIEVFRLFGRRPH